MIDNQRAFQILSSITYETYETGEEIKKVMFLGKILLILNF